MPIAKRLVSVSTWLAEEERKLQRAADAYEHPLQSKQVLDGRPGKPLGYVVAGNPLAQHRAALIDLENRLRPCVEALEAIKCECLSQRHK